MKNLISKLFFGRDTASSATTVRRCICVFILIYTVMPAQRLQAIVTSDDPPPPNGNSGIFSHVVTAGTKPYGMDHDGVARIYLYDAINEIEGPWASGSRLEGTNYILTAAHVVNEFLHPDMTALYDKVRADFNGINDNTPVGAELVPGSFKRYPDWNGNVLDGYDVALIKMSAIPGEIPGYNISSADPLGGIRVLAGYGYHGHGSFGQSGTGGLTVLRTGLNIFEAHPGIELNPDLTRGNTQIAYDFEEPGNPDTSFYNLTEVGFGDEEVSFADYDSGGPSFRAGVGSTKPTITGVHSYIQNDLPGDVNPDFKSSWGDVGVDTWVGKFEIWNWIVFEAFAASGFHNEIDPLIPSTTQMDNPSNWYNDILPDSSRGGVIQWGGTYTVNGPQNGSSLNFRDLTLGGEEGIKTLSFSGGGSFSAVDNISMPKNAVIIHEVGAVSATELIVGGEYGLTRAQYFWTDSASLGSSSLQANRIVVGAGGDFIHNWSNWTTGTLSAPGGGYVDLDVQSGGRAFLQRNTAGFGDITNDGILSLGEYVYANNVLADTFTQTADGAFVIYYANDASSGLLADWIAVFGPVELAGSLDLIMLGASIPAIGDSDFILTYSSLVGAFETVNGTDLGNGSYLALLYGANALTIQVQLDGDLNGDGFVGVDDLNLVLVNWNQWVPTGSPLDGDISGDGFVGVDDLNLVLVNWNNGTPPEIGAVIPEPAALTILSMSSLCLIRRRNTPQWASMGARKST